MSIINFIYLFGALIVLGVIFQFYAFYRFYTQTFLKYRGIKKNAEEVECEIVDIHWRLHNFRTVCRNPIVIFQTTNNERIESISMFSISLLHDDIKIGNKMTIIYNVNNPTDCFVKNCHEADLADIFLWLILIGNVIFSIFILMAIFSFFWFRLWDFF
jgi:hypothetical protein